MKRATASLVWSGSITSISELTNTDHEANLQQSWHDNAWMPLLNQANIMEYFTQPSNPFYDRGSNNEMIRMQRLSPEHMINMTGLEYTLIHTQEPILYIIRAQMRQAQNHVIPLADYYIVAGVVYQAPDLCSLINSRLLNAVHDIESAFEEAQSFSRYHPSKGYWWEFKNQQHSIDKQQSKEKKKKKEEPSSLFQRQRVDQLLLDLAQKFPPKVLAPSFQEKKEELKAEPKVEVKSEKSGERAASAQSTNSKQPAEKKAKLMR